jgi:hypothetical protein
MKRGEHIACSPRFVIIIFYQVWPYRDQRRSTIRAAIQTDGPPGRWRYKERPDETIYYPRRYADGPATGMTTCGHRRYKENAPIL